MARFAALLQQPQVLFALALVVSIVAFWPQLYSQLTTIDAAHLFHGLTATAWMAIPVVQSWLAAGKRFRAHRLLGRIWLLFAPVVVVSGLHMVQLMIREYEMAPEQLLMKFAFLDLVGMALFVTFLVLAITNVRERPYQRWHSSLVRTCLPRRWLIPSPSSASRYGSPRSRCLAGHVESSHAAA